MSYRKIVHVWSMGVVRARVVTDDQEEREVGWETFSVLPWRGLEMTIAKAHKWADERIRICEAWEAS